MFTQITEESIDKLMDIFYTKVRMDKRGLGEVFIKAIGEQDDVWVKHKAKIARFWKSMLLNIPGYEGQPLKTHLDLPPFPRELFSVWLGLFEESLAQVYAPEPAALILERARMIAGRFQTMLYDYGH